MEKPTPHDGTGPSRHSSKSFDDLQHIPLNDAPPPQNPPPVRNPPQTAYYPQPMGYPNQPYHGYPPGYAPYPNEYPPQPYNYGAQSPYYPPQTQPYPNRSNHRSFIRGFVLCSCIMFTIFFVFTVIMALVMHPEAPVYKVVSLSVDNFNMTTSLSCNWNAVVSVENPNNKLRTFFSDFEVAVVYKRDEVALGNALGFELDKREVKELNVRSASNGASVDLNAMAKERESGSITFSLKLSSITAFKSSSVSTRGEMMLALCNDLKVVFQNNSTSGLFTTANDPITCKVFI